MKISPRLIATGKSMASSPHRSRPDSDDRPSPTPSRATPSPSDRSPRKWFHRTLGRSLPGSPSGHAASHLRNLAGIRGLVRTKSRQALRASGSNSQLDSRDDLTTQQSTSTDNYIPGDTNAPRCCPPTLIVHSSDISSIESLTPDQSGLSNDPSQPETPASIGSQGLSLLADEQVLDDGDMGNKVSSTATVIRKPAPAHVKKEQTLVTPGSESIDILNSPQELPAEAGPPRVLRHRVSTAKVSIPRRRSSLTTLHLDRSHFERPLSPKSNQFDARAGSFSESFRPDVMIAETTTSTPPLAPPPPATLAPALISPLLSSNNSRPSTAGSESTSQGPPPNHLHLPATFPGGGTILTPTPPLTKTHYHCYQFHKRIRYSQNKTYPVPCMTCGLVEGESRWKCTWCALRICGGCMAEFDIRGRSLEKLMEWVVVIQQASSSSSSRKEAEAEAEAGGPPALKTKDPNASQTTLTVRRTGPVVVVASSSSTTTATTSESRSRGASVSTEKATTTSKASSSSSSSK